MCDRIGCTHFPKLSEMDFSGNAVPSRRRFLKGVVAVGTAASGVGLQGQGANRVSGFDHVAVPMQNTREFARLW